MAFCCCTRVIASVKERSSSLSKLLMLEVQHLGARAGSATWKTAPKAALNISSLFSYVVTRPITQVKQVDVNYALNISCKGVKYILAQSLTH
jgi:hypothetical protein